MLPASRYICKMSTLQNTKAKTSTAVRTKQFMLFNKKETFVAHKQSATCLYKYLHACEQTARQWDLSVVSAVTATGLSMHIWE